MEDENLLLQIDLLEKAITLDPGFALAYTRLSNAHSRSYHYGDRTDARRQKALDAAKHALRLQPDLPEGHLALGLYHYWCFRDYEKAGSELEIARAGLPNDARVLSALGTTSKRQGMFKEAIEFFRRALELNPRGSALAGEIAICYQSLRQYDKALEFFNLTISLQPDNWHGYRWMFQLYLWHMGDLTAARQILHDVPKSAGGPSFWSWHILEVFERDYDSALLWNDTISKTWTGETFWEPPVLSRALTYKYMGAEHNAHRAFDSARHLLESSLLEHHEDYRIHAALGVTYAGLGFEEQAIQHGQYATELLPILKDAIDGPHLVEDLARIHTFLGHYDVAIDKLEYLLSIPSYHLGVGKLRLAPDWDPLRDHPRFQALLEKYGGEQAGT
jgi:serine/threonine-protein kinase